MRVLAGRYKSKLIRTINDPLTRPMMSKVRESIFNSLQFNIENKDILDLYAGSGSLGIESLSRGANFVTFIENSDDCITILKKNLNEFEKSKITKMMWCNYGKILAEYVFIKNFRETKLEQNVIVKGQEILEKIQINKKPVII